MTKWDSWKYFTLNSRKIDSPLKKSPIDCHQLQRGHNFFPFRNPSDIFPPVCFPNYQTLCSRLALSLYIYAFLCPTKLISIIGRAIVLPPLIDSHSQHLGSQLLEDHTHKKALFVGVSTPFECVTLASDTAGTFATMINKKYEQWQTITPLTRD